MASRKASDSGIGTTSLATPGVVGRLRVSLAGVCLAPNPAGLDEKTVRYYLTKLLSAALVRTEEDRFRDGGEFGSAIEELLACCTARSRWSMLKDRIAALLSPGSRQNSSALSRPLTAMLGRRVASAIDSAKLR